MVALTLIRLKECDPPPGDCEAGPRRHVQIELPSSTFRRLKESPVGEPRLIHMNIDWLLDDVLEAPDARAEDRKLS